MGCRFNGYEKIFKRKNGYKYLLKVIDTFSKFVWAAPIKNKDGATVSKAFKKIIENAKTQNHKPPNLLHTDKGRELKNNNLKVFWILLTFTCTTLKIWKNHP